MSPADAAAERTLARLAECYPLGEGWTELAHFSESVLVATTRIELCGLSARRDGEIATGSAAGVGEGQVARAYFELVERTSILEAMSRASGMLVVRDREGHAVAERASDEIFGVLPTRYCVYARSNGVAVGLDWSSACKAARFELLERDRVLRSWYGGTPPRRAELGAQPLAALHGLYELEAYTFPVPDRACGPHVAAVFAFPRRDEHPIVYGFGANEEEQSALAKASGECLQRIGFLWDQTLPSCEPEFAPNAEYHQEFYLQPRMAHRLRAWLAGKHSALHCGIRQHDRVYRERTYVDLTPKHLEKRLFVVKALPVSELTLTFGHGHPDVEPPLPDELLVHPIA